jgi:hypothetical protein
MNTQQKIHSVIEMVQMITDCRDIAPIFDLVEDITYHDYVNTITERVLERKFPREREVLEELRMGMPTVADGLPIKQELIFVDIK